jgi:hypothetical protein
VLKAKASKAGGKKITKALQAPDKFDKLADGRQVRR